MSLNPAISSAGKKRILIVDDHPIVRYGLTKLIHSTQTYYVCGELDDAKHLDAAIQRWKPDLLIMDLVLKGSLCFPALKELQSHSPKLPTLVISMHGEFFYADKALKAGAKGYLIKEDAMESILTALETIFNGKIFLSPELLPMLLGKYQNDSTVSQVSGVESLSDRELQVFCLVGGGKDTKTIAHELSLSVKTIETHLERIKEKLGIKTLNQLLRFATLWLANSESSSRPRP